MPNCALFYSNVINSLYNLAGSAISKARHDDVIQLKLIGVIMRNHVSVTIYDETETVLSDFQALLDRLVQSNFSVMMDTSLELVVQVVNIRLTPARLILEKLWTAKSYFN